MLMKKIINIWVCLLLLILGACNKPLTDIQCHESGFKVSISWNEKDGTLTANTTNGAPPFTYKWSTGHTNFQTINISGKGLFSVTVTDFETCSVSASFEIK